MADGLPSPMPGPGHLPSSFDDNNDFYNERPMQKVVRKLKEEPLVPLGIGLTVFAFVNAYRALRRGDSRQANKMFRARVAAQGFTVIAMVAGSMYYSQDRQKTKELRKLKEERDAEEKRQKWIRELEVRDEEEKMIKASMEKRRQKVEVMNATAKKEGDKGTDGVLGKMGLWSKGQEAVNAEEEKTKEEETKEEKTKEEKTKEEKTKEEKTKVEKTKKENPMSSLGAISEVLVKQKNGEGKK